ncbi:hypothetical protein, partial [Xanthomonas sacchari]
ARLAEIVAERRNMRLMGAPGGEGDTAPAVPAVYCTQPLPSSLMPAAHLHMPPVQVLRGA